MTELITQPWANQGDTQAPPQTSSQGFANWSQGYTSFYELALGGSNPSPNAKAVERMIQNYLFYCLSGNAQAWQQMSSPPWFASMPSGYAQDAVVIRNGKPYRSLVANNVSDPATTPTQWAYVPRPSEMIANIPMPAGGTGGSGAELVTAATDFNTFTASGTYEFQSDAVVNGSPHSPTNVSGMLEVKAFTTLDHSSIVIQRYFDRNLNQWIRTSSNSVWSGWRDLAFTDSPAFTGTPTSTTPAQNDNSTMVATTQWGNGIASHGQCRLNVASATSLNLTPFNGQNIIIGGTVQQVPTAGITLSNAGLSALTLYYVYATMNAGAMTLVASTTGHVTGSNGVKVCSSNSAYTLVGMVYPNASSQFQFTGSWIGCISHFNRRNVNVGNTFTGTLNFSNTSVGEISSSLRATFLMWADECVTGGADGEFVTNASSGAASVALTATIDGAYGSTCSYTTLGVNYGQVFSSHMSISLSEGVHTASIYGNVNGCTGTLIEGAVAWVTRG